MDYPPSQGSAMILDAVINADPNKKLKLLISFCIQYFNLRGIPINKRLGCILYLLIQCSVVQSQQLYTLDDDTLSKLLSNESLTRTKQLLTPWVKNKCQLQFPKNIL